MVCSKEEVGNALHIVNNRTPFLQVSRDLVNHFLSVGGIGPLVRVVADQSAIAV